MKLILQTLLILLIVATFSICAIQPDLHKNVIVYDSNYTLVTEEEVKTETKEVPVVEMPVKPIEKTTVAEKKAEPVRSTSMAQTNTVKKQNQAMQKQVVQAKQTVKKPEVKTVTKTAENNFNTTKKSETNQVVTPKIEEKNVEKIVEQPKTLTPQEETVAWNIWRSNLTNKIMQDTKLPNIPNGTVFQFSFNVDKYGKISNVQTGANPANYTPYAIQYIAPVIRSYQGHSILNFPEGTARTTTQVTGKWRITDTAKYSTPQDFNDIEKVVRY